MRVRERRDHEQRVQPLTPARLDQETHSDTPLDVAERFLAAGEEAIQRALSHDSEGFLTANQQEGGQ
jgi:hypothetical protein